MALLAAHAYFNFVFVLGLILGLIPVLIPVLPTACDSASQANFAGCTPGDLE
jgi:hypothetical protein